MRMLRALAAGILSLLMVAPAALGQWHDPAGDHQVGYTARSQFDDASYVWTNGKETGWFPQADVTQVLIHEETDDTITFEVRIASEKPKGDEPAPVDYIHYQFSFVLHGQQRMLRITWPLARGEPVATLRTIDNQTSHVDESFDATPTTDGPGWKVQLPKFRFRDGDLLPIRAGDKLEEIRFRDFTALGTTMDPCYFRMGPDGDNKCWKAKDDVQGGAPLGEYVVTRQPAGVGHLELTSPAPLRSSNGLATTYVFEVIAHNLGAGTDQALVKLSDVPADWQVQAPTLVEVPGKGRTTFPVAVTVPFVHEHGRESYINVSVHSRGQPDIGAQQTLGVVWTRVPQPSGHHAELFLHGASYRGWMNTLKVDPEDEGGGELDANSYSIRSNFDSFQIDLRYHIDLQPALALGLDFDMGRNVVADYAVKARSTMKGAVTTELVLVDRDNKRTVLATGTSPERNFAAGETINVHHEMAPAPVADRIPYAEDSNLQLVVNIKGGGSYDPVSNVVGDDGFEAPRVLTVDSLIQLPLVEFREVTDESLLSSLTRFSLHGRTPTVKQVNPGKTAAFGFDITNHGDEAEVLDWTMIGANTDWARIEPPAVRVAPGDNATVLVAVQPPDVASDGEAAEILLLGRSRSDENAQVYVRLIAQVVTSREIPDESDYADSLREEASANRAGAPAASLAAILGAVGLAVGLRRRSGLS